MLAAFSHARIGSVVGVVSARLNDIEVLKASGSLPQNVNFAIRGDLAQGFLRANGVEPAIQNSTSALSASEIAKNAQAYTVQVLCTALQTATADLSTATASPNNDDPSDRIRSFIADEYLNGDLSSASHLRQVYADPVNYWDKGEVPFAVVIADKVSYSQKWESLRFQLRPASMKIAPLGSSNRSYSTEFVFDFVAVRNRRVI